MPPVLGSKRKGKAKPWISDMHTLAGAEKWRLIWAGLVLGLLVGWRCQVENEVESGGCGEVEGTVGADHALEVGVGFKADGVATDSAGLDLFARDPFETVGAEYAEGAIGIGDSDEPLIIGDG